MDANNVYALRGSLDDVTLWNRAMHVDAVASMYEAQRDYAYYCCPSVCPEGTVSTGLCVGDVRTDCRPAYPCPKCSVGM